MIYGAIVRSPVLGGAPDTVDDDAAAKAVNVRHLRLTRKRSLAVDMHHAGAKEVDAAAELRAGEFVCSRITQRSGVMADASTLTVEPFTVNWKVT
jgi:hypothetical protein